MINGEITQIDYVVPARSESVQCKHCDEMFEDENNLREHIDEEHVAKETTEVIYVHMIDIDNNAQNEVLKENLNNRDYKDHSIKVVKKVKQKSGWIARSLIYNTIYFKRFMCRTYIQGLIDYGSQVW